MTKRRAPALMMDASRCDEYQKASIYTTNDDRKDNVPFKSRSKSTEKIKASREKRKNKKPPAGSWIIVCQRQGEDVKQ